MLRASYKLESSFPFLAIFYPIRSGSFGLASRWNLTHYARPQFGTAKYSVTKLLQSSENTAVQTQTFCLRGLSHLSVPSFLSLGIMALDEPFLSVTV